MDSEQFMGINDEVYSGWKFAHHKKALEAIKKKEAVAPISVQIDPEGRCNHNCTFCSYRNAGWEERGMEFLEQTRIPLSTMERLIDELQKLGVKSIELTGGGEPTLYPHFDEMMKMLAETYMELGIVTNGSAFNWERIDMINPETIRWIRFSMDSTTQETHKKVHGISSDQFKTILSRIRYVVKKKLEWHRDFRLGISFIIVPENIHEIDEAAKFYRSLGVDNIRYSFTYDKNQDGRLTPKMREEVFKRLEKAKSYETPKFRVFGWKSRLDDYAASNSGINFCTYQYGTMVIGSDGGVWECCIRKYYPEHCLGNINKHTLHHILLGEQRKVDFNPTGCPPCWMANKIFFVQALLNDTLKESMTEEQQEAFEKYMKRNNPPHVNYP